MAFYLCWMAGGDDGPRHWSGKRMQMVTEQDRRYGICIMHKGRNANGCMINMKAKTCDRRFRLRRRGCQVCNQTAVATSRRASATRQWGWPRWLRTADRVVSLIILFSFVVIFPADLVRLLFLWLFFYTLRHTRSVQTVRWNILAQPGWQLRFWVYEMQLLYFRNVIYRFIFGFQLRMQIVK